VRPDTIKLASSKYTRYAPDGVQVRFNTTGEHIVTKSRLAPDSTLFSYSSGRLSTITLPPAGGSQTYSFTYNNPNNRLSLVTGV
jgi:hypothetical protein